MEEEDHLKKKTVEMLDLSIMNDQDKQLSQQVSTP